MTEGEIDVRRYWSAVAARWWLPVVGLLAGAALGYALSLGGADVWRGVTLVYLGQPVTPAGAQVQSLSTNPSAAVEIANAPALQRRVEREVGLRRGELSGSVSVAAAPGNLTRLGQNPLIRIRVDGESRRVAQASTMIAREVAARVSDYANGKIRVLEETIAANEEELAQLDERIEGARGDSGGFLLLRRGELRSELLAARQTLLLAQTVERARVVEEAVARRVTAQSRRNQIVVGAVLGLLAGLAAALVWESAAALRRR